MTAPYQLLPPLSAEEYAALRSDIEASGVRVPIDLDEEGNILDGHHRAAIAEGLGIDCPHRFLPAMSEAEKVAHALSVNVHRRTLTREQKRELIAKSLAADPALSDREHGKRTGSDGKTVATVRGEMESTAEIPQLAERKGADGKTRPAPPGPAIEAAALVEQFPELAYYADAGQTSDVIRLGRALHGYAEPERTMRRANLNRAIAAEQRRTEDPIPDATGPDWHALADEMFYAANTAAGVIARCGGADTFANALDVADPIEAENWHGQFTELAAACTRLAAACRPTLRRIK